MGEGKAGTEPGNSAQASRQSARSSLTTLPTALAPIGLMTVPAAIRRLIFHRRERADVKHPTRLLLVECGDGFRSDEHCYTPPGDWRYLSQIIPAGIGTCHLSS